MPARKYPSLVALSLWAIACMLTTQTAGAVNPSNYSVQVSAVVQPSPPQIKLVWSADPYARSYTVYRKSFGVTSWGTGTPLSGGAISYIDKNVSVGGKYEYRVSKTGFQAATGTRYTGHGYIYASIQAPLIAENRGKLLLIVDNTYADALVFELKRLEQDLIGDGWQVLRHDVSRTARVSAVKSLIKADYNADPNQVKAVFLFGHVPVPYSGGFNADRHPEHKGAWPADVFYGDMDGVWTDSKVNDSSALRIENRNVPGDGKYDQSVIPSDVELMVGRVDLSDMPAFPKSERELLRQYLNKDHNFRHKLFSVAARGLIDDKFGPFQGEAFAASGWRNFAPFFGAGNIDVDESNNNPAANTTFDWFPRLTNNSYLWGYGAAGGTYTSAGDDTGIGETGPGTAPVAKKVPPLHNFVETDTKVVFTMLFGSFFGDWDNKNNFMRAPLATTTYGLTSAWAGIPHWFFHHMALGEPIGYSTRLTQNNDGLYTNDINNFTRGVHIALMGDPTLRMHPVKPPSNLLCTITSKGVNLDWAASSDTAVRGYHVYRAATPDGPFRRLTSAPLAGTSFIDTNALSGSYTYMVRTVKMQTSASGSYLNLSQGIFDTINVGSASDTLQFSTSNYSTNEGAGSATITVTRSAGSGVVSVNYSTSNGLAAAGADYTAKSGTLTFSDGDTSQSFTVPIIDDTTVEPDETVNLTLSSPTGGATLGSRRSATLTILNDDTPPVVAGTLQFSTGNYSVNEGAGSATITITRSGGSDGAVSVIYVTGGGTAVAGADYTAKSGTISFADGEAGSKIFSIAITDDTVVEPNETVNLTLSKPSGGATLGKQSSAVLTIVNNDTPPGALQFSAANYSVGEGAGSATITVTRSGGSNGAVSVRYATSDGSATAGADYTAKSGTISFADGDTAPKTFTVSIIDDCTLFSEGNETVNITLSNPADGATLGTPDSAILTIIDNDFLFCSQ